MFDLDRLADFDRGLARIVPVPGLTRDLCPAPAGVAGGDGIGGATVARCTMISTLGVEPLCPFARIEAA